MANGHLVSITAKIENDPEGWDYIHEQDYESPEQLKDVEERYKADTLSVVWYLITVAYIRGTSGHIHTIHASLSGIENLTGTAQERDEGRNVIFSEMENDIAELSGELRGILTTSEIAKFKREAKAVCQAAVDDGQTSEWEA